MTFQVGAGFAIGRRRDLIANGLFDLFHPFSREIWLSIAATLLLTQMVALLVAKVEAKMRLQPVLIPKEVS